MSPSRPAMTRISMRATPEGLAELAERLLATNLTAEQRALAEDIRVAARSIASVTPETADDRCRDAAAGDAAGPAGARSSVTALSRDHAADRRAAEERARILVVDDSESNRALALLHLDRLGYEAVAVEDGWTALDRLAGEPFDLVLLDGMMPGLDGPATAREIRRREAGSGAEHLPIVALTASILPEDRAILLEAGMDDHLAKPIRIEELSRVLGEQLLGIALRRGVVISAPASQSRPGHRRPAADPVVDAGVFGRLGDLGDPLLTERLVRLFLADAAERVRQVDAALFIGDAARLRIALEALEGSCGGVGAAALLRRARELHDGVLRTETGSQPTPASSGLGELLDETRAWFDRALEAARTA